MKTHCAKLAVFDIKCHWFWPFLVTRASNFENAWIRFEWDVFWMLIKIVCCKMFSPYILYYFFFSFRYSFVRVGRFRFSTWPQEAFWRRLTLMMELFGPCVSLQTRYNINLSFKWQRASHPYKTPICYYSEFLTIPKTDGKMSARVLALCVHIWLWFVCVNAERDCNWWCWQDCEILGLWAHKGWGHWEEQVSYYLQTQTTALSSRFLHPSSWL